MPLAATRQIGYAGAWTSARATHSRRWSGHRRRTAGSVPILSGFPACRQVTAASSPASHISYVAFSRGPHPSLLAAPLGHGERYAVKRAASLPHCPRSEERRVGKECVSTLVR